MRTPLVLLCVSMLAACGSAAPPAEAPPPPPAPNSEATSPAVPPPDESPPPENTPAPTHLAQEPALEAMRPAIRSAKMTVPVDLSYRFSADPVTGQPTVLHLAAVPRVAGTNLNVSIKEEPGVRVDMAPGAANIQKASAAGIYRKQIAVTRTDPGATRVRVLVTMDLPYGSGFGFFSIPLDPDSVKQQ